MKRLKYLIGTLCLGLTLHAQLPDGWYMSNNDKTLEPGNPKDYNLGTDKGNKYSGKASAFIESRNSTPEGIAFLVQEASPVDYKGKRVKLTAFVNADGVQNWAGVFLQLETRLKSVVSDFMYDRPIKGTVEWKKREIVVDVPADAERVFIGMWLQGKGKIWADDFLIEVVGEDVAVTAGRRILKRPRNMTLEE